MNPLDIVSRPICEQDVARIRTAFDDRIVRYKLKGDWANRFELPVPYHHNGTVCIDEESNALFTQVPHHFQDEYLERYVILVGAELAALQSRGYPLISVAFVTKSLWTRLPYLYNFSQASLKKSGNCMSDSIPDASFFTEASAFTR